MARRQRSFSEILQVAKRLRKAYASGSNIEKNIANNQRITNAGRNATKNLAKSLKVDASLLSYPNFRNKRGLTTRLGLSAG